MRRMQAFFTNASAEEGSDLVVFGEPARLTQPGKGSFRNPEFGQYLEDMLLAVFDHLHAPTQHAQRPIDQAAYVATIAKMVLRHSKCKNSLISKALAPARS